MLCKNFTKFLIVLFILKANLAQHLFPRFMLMLNESNFNSTIEFYRVVYVSFLSSNYNSKNFWFAYLNGLVEIENKLGDNLYAAVGTVECIKEKSICKRYNIKHNPTIKVIKSGKENDTFVGRITKENLLRFIDKHLDDDHRDLGSGDSNWNDDIDVSIEIEQFTINYLNVSEINEYSTESSSTDFLTYVTTEVFVTEEPDNVSSTSYAAVDKMTTPEFSFEEDITEEIYSGENSTENSESDSKANFNRATNLISLLLLLYYIHL